MQGPPSLSRFQPSTLWPRNVYIVLACKFSKSSGPVRYTPKGARQQGRVEQAIAQPQTKKPSDVSERNEVEEIHRFSSSRPSKKVASNLKAPGDVDNQSFRSAEVRGTYSKVVQERVENSPFEQVSPESQRINGKREVAVQAGSLISPLKLSDPNSFSVLQSFVSKVQETASQKKAATDGLARVRDTASLPTARAVDYAANPTPENEDDFLADDVTDMPDDTDISADEFSVLDNELDDTSRNPLANQLNDVQSTRLREAEAPSRAAQAGAKREAIRYLAMRQYTAFQLREKLRSRNISPELVEYAIAAVQDCGMQSDLMYAETFAHSRWNVGSWGPQRIKQALKQRGVSDDIVKIAIDRVFNENNDDFDHGDTNSTGMSKSAIDQLLMQANKQWNRGKNVPDDTKVRRMISWLQYRGFNFKVTQIVLKHLRKKRMDSEI